MKIVIDIEEGRYNWIMSHASNDAGDYANTEDLFFRKAVESGIVLPKGHGDLIDRDYFIDKYAGCGSVYCEDISCNECNSRIVSKFDVDNASAVIPTDR